MQKSPTLLFGLFQCIYKYTHAQNYCRLVSAKKENISLLGVSPRMQKMLERVAQCVRNGGTHPLSNIEAAVIHADCC